LDTVLQSEFFMLMFMLGVFITFGSLLYAAVALIAQLWPLGHEEEFLDPVIGVTVLKPLCGVTTETYKCLSSFCLQTHSTYQLLFGVADDDDPVIALIARLRSEFPERDIRLVIDRRQHGTSRKVSNLVNMMPHARYDLLVLSDSDVEVEGDYLQRVVGPLRRDDVGIVTCMYRGMPVSGVWSRLGALFLNEWFTSSVRVAALFGSRQFAFGATIAIRRETLRAIGGFEALADQLADDYRLGELTRVLGKETVLSAVMVDVQVGDASFKALALHELRWLRTIRAVRPVGYGLAVITMGPLVTLLGVLLSGGARWAYGCLLACVLLRVILHLIAAPRSTRLLGLALLPIREFLTPVLFLAAFLVRRVRWHENDYWVLRDGSLQPTGAGGAS
jgi:ceramide glucosyltransferase